jgi:perosamine synthetase
MPTFTIISCGSAITRTGATPVLVDADPVTWNMNCDEVAAKITPATKAIMVVHIYGLPVDMDPILELAKKHNLKIVEDSAEMHGQDYKGRPCGSFGDVSIFSFYPNKHITTGEGGMILTDSEEIAEYCRSARNLCFMKHKRFVHEELGWNYRMTNLQAALGVAQMERLDEFVVLKRKMGNTYSKLLAGIDCLEFPLLHTAYADNIFWVFGVVLKDDYPLDAEQVMARLKQEGVDCRPFFWPMHEQPVFHKMGLFNGEKYPVAERIARRGFYIPSGLALTEEEMNTVAQTVRRVLS